MENQCTEYKSVWRDEYLKWLCGFANANGGVLYIGKNDNSETVGVKDVKNLLEELPNKIRTTMGMVADVSLHSENDKDFIKVDIAPYPSPISYHGKYYLRSGATNQELTGNALDEFILRKQGRTWDSVPVPYLKVEDFDRDAFRLFREKAISSGRLTKEDVNISDVELFESLSLTENNYLKRASILTFHQRPTKWFLGAYVKIGYFRTNADLVYQDEINGSILSMPDKVIDLIYTKYLKGYIRYEGLQRIDEYPVPKGALREAILNAIVHRDYSTGIPIQIKIYDDKIIIYNDGILPDHWDINDLLNAHRSRPHNPFIANTFFRSGQIEAWGRGIDRIKEECRRFGTEVPIFKSNGSDVATIFQWENTNYVIINQENVIVNQENVIVNEENDIIKVKNDIINDENDIISKKDMMINTVLQIITQNENISADEIAKQIGKSLSTTMRHLKTLKKEKKIEYHGARKTGGYKIVKNDNAYN